MYLIFLNKITAYVCPVPPPQINTILSSTLLILFLLFLFFPSISSIPYWQRVEEQEYFNWTCVICSVLAQFSLHLELQFIVEHGPYTDLDGEKWIKCSKYSSPYHVKCLSIENSVGEYICTFMACKN